MEKKMTLLEKAQQSESKNADITPETLELTKAWLEGKINLTQVMHALRGINTNHYTFLALNAKALWQDRWKPANEKQEESRMLRITGTPLLEPIDFDMLRKTFQPKKPHWTQRPEYKRKLKRVVKQMLEGKKNKRQFVKDMVVNAEQSSH